jgi:hypothetical protein
MLGSLPWLSRVMPGQLWMPHAAASDMGRGQRVALTRPGMLRIRKIQGSEYFESFWLCFSRWSELHGSCMPGREVRSRSWQQLPWKLAVLQVFHYSG